MHRRIVLVPLVCLLGTGLVSAQPGKATGTLTIDGTVVTLAHAVRVTTPNVFDEFSLDPVVVLSDRPLTVAEASDEARLLERAARGELSAAALRFDGRRGRGRLFNVTIRHKGLAEPVLLPDVYFQYTFKDGAGTLAMTPREFAGRTYAATAEFSVPVPKETTEAAAVPAEAAGLPPPSKTDADRAAATALLIQTMQEGDETRALEVVKLGIDPNGRDQKMGIAAINWAVLMCQPLVVKALVELKADTTHERLPGMTLLTEAQAACPDAVPFLKVPGAR